mgnify:FL=1
MTRDEVIKLQMIIQAAYPGYNPPNKTITVDLWDKMLKDWTYCQAEAAVAAFIRTDKRGFPPGIGAIIDKLQMLFGEEDLNEEEAWGMVQRAIRNSTYHAEEEFQKLPRVIQRAIASPSRLAELAAMENMNVTVESSNFKRTYRSVLQSEKEIRKLPPGLMEMARNRLPQSDQKRIEAGERHSDRNERDEVISEMPERAKQRMKQIFEEYRVD